MSFPAVTLPGDASLEDVIAAMEGHQIRRLPVVDDEGCCAGIIAQADLAFVGPPMKTAELLCELSRDKETKSA
jgi:CBS-domain-containing membrane protein